METGTHAGRTQHVLGVSEGVFHFKTDTSYKQIILLMSGATLPALASRWLQIHLASAFARRVQSNVDKSPGAAVVS